ncbi:Uncharacterised protein [Shigella sonnei]|nr:Uncharacterised protein [Shigella sonnei]
MRASAQHKLKIIPQTKQFRLGVTVGDRHQRPFLRQLF